MIGGDRGERADGSELLDPEKTILIVERHSQVSVV